MWVLERETGPNWGQMGHFPVFQRASLALFGLRLNKLQNSRQLLPSIPLILSQFEWYKFSTITLTVITIRAIIAHDFTPPYPSAPHALFFSFTSSTSFTSFASPLLSPLARHPSRP